MPKELTHWHIAREALRRAGTTQVGKIIACNPALYYIGAVAHDIGFCDFSKPAETNLEQMANQLHGVDGENTLEPVIKIMEMALSQNSKHTQLAFLLGMLSHFVADSIFHPMVYYMSGNYFASDLGEREKAVFRHRLFETAIDLWIDTVDPLEDSSDLIHFWRETDEVGQEAFEMIVENFVYLGHKSIRAHFKKAWRNYRFLQTAFSWSTPWRVLDFYGDFGALSIKRYEALFYAQPLNLSFFDSSFEWRHPVTGAPYKMPLVELFDESVEKVITLFERLNTQSIENWPFLLRALQPLSLDSGLPYVGVSQMKYFGTEPIEQRLRV